MNITIDKEVYIIELEKVLKYYYEAKTIDNKEQVKYFQGMVKGMLFILKKQNVITDNEIQMMVESIELDIPTIYREQK